MTIGENINRIRKEKNYSIEKLARKAHISKATIGSWVYLNVSPTVELLILVADVLGVSLDELVGRNFPKS